MCNLSLWRGDSQLGRVGSSSPNRGQRPLALGAQSLSNRTTREVLGGGSLELPLSSLKMGTVSLISLGCRWELYIVVV